MSLYDWMARRGTKPGEEPIAEEIPTAPTEAPAPELPSPTPPAATSPPPPQTDGKYSAADFLPISRFEIVEAGQGGSLMANLAATGLSSKIPPADDPRTKLIDRALVTHGYLTPEELVEIHRIGEEYGRLKPDLYQIAVKAGLAGEAAVAAYREAKQRIREEKKAAAEARKRQREEEVKRRREADIIFLGRGVSSRLHLRLSDEVRLAELGLPVMHAPADVAKALGLSIKQLRWLAYHTDAATRTHYVKFQVPKRSGGLRTLAAPHKMLKQAQRWVLAEIVSKLPVTEPAHGFVAARGIVTNASPHVGRAIVVNMDLENFFPSITFPRVRAVFERHGYSGSVASVFALLCTECPRMTAIYDGTAYEVATGPRGLPQGAPTSPGLSNQVARKLDPRLTGLAKSNGLTYTRYADDLTFSGGPDLALRIGYLMSRVRHIAEHEGFTVNEKKSRVMRRHAAQTVTGVVVNDKPSLAREELRRLRAILHRARTEALEAQNRDDRPNFRAWLEGKIAFLSMVRPDVGAKLRAQYKAIGGAER
jgi:retron-type reverse transcriptase